MPVAPNTPLGDTTDAVVAAGAAGSLSAKLRRLTTDLAAFAALYPAVASLAPGLAKASLSRIGVVPLLDNGATLDPQTGNYEFSWLTSASRSSSPSDSSDFTNYNCRGLWLIVDVTAITGGPGTGITPRVLGKTAYAASYQSLHAAPTAITAVGTYTYAIYPGIAAGATQNTSGVLPRTFKLRMTHSDSTPYTYTVSGCLLV